MGRQREHGVRVREIEPDAFRGQPVERGRSREASGTTQRVGAQRINRDQQHILAGDRLQVRLCRRPVGKPDGSPDENDGADRERDASSRARRASRAGRTR